MKFDKATDERLITTFDIVGPKVSLELGDRIVRSVLAMRVTGLREGMIKESNADWLQRLINEVEQMHG